MTAYIIAILDTSARPPTVLCVDVFSEDSPTLMGHRASAVLGDVWGRTYANAHDAAILVLASAPYLAWARPYLGRCAGEVARARVPTSGERERRPAAMAAGDGGRRGRGRERRRWPDMTAYQRGNRDAMLSFVAECEARADAMRRSAERLRKHPTMGDMLGTERYFAVDAWTSAADLARRRAEALPEDPEAAPEK